MIAAILLLNIVQVLALVVLLKRAGLSLPLPKLPEVQVPEMNFKAQLDKKRKRKPVVNDDTRVALKEAEEKKSFKG